MIPDKDEYHLPFCRTYHAYETFVRDFKILHPKSHAPSHSFVMKVWRLMYWCIAPVSLQTRQEKRQVLNRIDSEQGRIKHREKHDELKAVVEETFIPRLPSVQWELWFCVDTTADTQSLVCRAVVASQDSLNATFTDFLYGIGSFFVVNAGENEHYLGFLVGEVINKHCIESRTTAFRVQWYLSFESAHTYTAQYWPWMITNKTGKLDVPREGRRNADIIHCNFNAVTSNKPISVTVENHLQLLVSHRVL